MEQLFFHDIHIHIIDIFGTHICLCRICIFRVNPVYNLQHMIQFFCFMILAVLAVYRRIDPLPVNGQKIVFRDLLYHPLGFHPIWCQIVPDGIQLYIRMLAFSKDSSTRHHGADPVKRQIAAVMKESIIVAVYIFPSPILCRQFTVIRIFPGYIIALIISICHMFQTFFRQRRSHLYRIKNWIFRYIGRLMAGNKNAYIWLFFHVLFPVYSFLFRYCCSSLTPSVLSFISIIFGVMIISFRSSSTE